MIPDSFIQDLLARVDVADVVGRYVQLKKGGINLLGLCPFHNEKSPSFTVSPAKQFYHCFGCGAHGSAITFLIEHTGASFPEAVRTLASAVGMTVPEENRSPGQKAASSRRREEISQHTQVLELAQKHYLAQLRDSPAAIRYLKERGLTGQIAKEFGLGWASADRQALAKVFPRYDDPLLVESGLVIESEDGRRYDRFRERIMFPIRNAKGEIVGFGGRIIGKGEPKYLNSPETPVFSKGNELYGLFEARSAIRAEGCVIVVEGYMDVVGLAQLGVRHAVAALGTATTPTHIQKLLRASDKIIFSFDGDGAGRRAAWRALQASLPFLRDDISIRFLFLPAEHDPDSYIRKFGEEAFRACINESDALSTFFLNELAARHSVQELEGRSALVHEARPLLAQIPAIALKVQLQNELARLVQFTPEELSQLLAQEAPHKMAGLPDPGQPSAGAQARAGAAADEGPIFPSFGHENGSNEAGAPTRGGQFPAGRVRQGRQASAPRAVAPLARRLLRLLLTHPELVDQMGEQQIEILARGPHLEMVRDLIVLIQASGARHVGALIQAADPGADLGVLMISLAEDLMAQEPLPNPQLEWEDAVRRIELDGLKAEQQSLIGQGLNNLHAQQKYQELSQSITRLMRVIESSKTS
ncbi:DNA primase [Zwartia vadi]|uniref:DNA primase n=1 Tax=Zwartia vadi TaxID=3058168 RepID=UPI0025B50608|nr:DNA primase [Zwartia vadi]MDN3988436.1 DNA primase [Zwartia vadi]